MILFGFLTMLVALILYGVAIVEAFATLSDVEPSERAEILSKEVSEVTGSLKIGLGIGAALCLLGGVGRGLFGKEDEVVQQENGGDA